MENTNSVPQHNPLKKFFRQPKIYIKLPSSGNFYPPGAIEHTSTSEYPVFAMTAKDELSMKTPDALLNGQSTVDIIQSCVPNIKNAWLMPSLDVDAILVAIRLATYGENLDLNVRIPNTETTREYVADLRTILDKLSVAVFDPMVKINDQMTIFVRPLSYIEFTKNAIKTLEEQRILNVVNDDSMPEEQKIELFNKSFKKLTEITIDMVGQCIDKIVTPDGEVTDQLFIKEFIDNADKDFFSTIMEHLEKQKDQFSIEPFEIITTLEDRELGAPEKFTVPITLDTSNFFG